MRFTMEAACGCHVGKVRKNNEDNFFFDGRCLDQENCGLDGTLSFEARPANGSMVAVFDGMGGENFGEAASWAAARTMQQTRRRLADCFVSRQKSLLRLATKLNEAVVREKQTLGTERMGTTMVSLCFSSGRVYTCNVGDSRAYRLRGGELTQLSEDHVERNLRPGRRKPALTQHLGIDPAALQLEPHITRNDLRKGDVYLLCSDGLTDMLTDPEISGVMLDSRDARTCVRELIRAALERGGRDNITVIICKINEGE